MIKVKTWKKLKQCKRVLSVVVILIGALFIAFQIYLRYSVIICTETSFEQVRQYSDANASNGETLYNLYYRVCMGRRGLER